MKATKLILSILFIFSSVEGFSQTIQDAAICTKVGSKASFTVDYPTASTYVWQVKISTSSWITITSSNAGSVYSGYSSPTLNITKSSTTPFNGTLCRVIVNDGFNDLTSNVVTLTVNPLPVSKTITGASPVCIGGDITLIYGASSVGTIQWQSSPSPNSEDFYDIDGETLGSYTATGLEDTTWFRVKNSSGECGSVYSPAVQVVVNPLPVAGNIDGGDINVCSGSNTTTLTLYNHVGAIKWQKALDAAGSPGTPGTFSNILSAILPDYRATNLTATTYFRAVLSSGVCTSVTTDPVVIIVDPVPVSKLITGAAPVCAGGSKTLTYGTASVGDIKWQSSNSGNSDDFYDVDGEMELIYTATDLQETTWFRVKNSSGECGSVYSSAVKVIVNPLAVAGNIGGGDINVCKSSNSTVLTLYNYEGTIQWQKASEVGGSPGTFSNITSANLATYTASNLAATTYFRAIVSSGVCASETTEPVVITVDPALVSKLITGASPVCAGGSKELTYGAGSVGDILWQSSTSGDLNDFYDLEGAELIYTATDLQETTWFRVKNSIGTCSPAYSPAVQVIVNPFPIAGYVAGGDINVCKTLNATELTLYDYVGAIQWQKASEIAGSPGEFSNITSANLDKYTASSLTATTYFRAEVSNGVCTSEKTTPVVIIVEPTTSISADATVSTSTTITEGSAVPLQLNGSLNVSPNIQWTPATAISSTTISNPIVYPSTTTTYTASFINTYGCPQTTSIQVNVTPQPTIGNLSLTSSNTTIGLFDTINVDIQLAGATSLYSLFMKLKGNTAVNQYLDYSGYTSSTLLGSGNSVISTPPTVTNSVCDFGITSVGTSTGYSGSGLFYTLHFTPKNMLIPDGTVFCFYIDDVNAYNNSGIPCGLTNQGQYCYTYTNQVNVWSGDLNNSKTVTTADILPIGYFYNFTGPTRPNATIQWTAQPMTLWGGAYNHSTTNGNAYKVFADSNGDGVINNADQAAIGFNMSKIQARLAAPKTVTKNYTSKLAMSGGELIVTPNTSNINASLPQTVSFNVSLNNLGGLASLYGISVNLLFDDTFFDLSTATVEYANSIFGNASKDFLMMNYTSANMVSVGLTRYANAAINGQGLLFKVTLQTKSQASLSLTQTPVTAYVDAANNQGGDSLVVQDAPLTNFTVFNNNLSVNTMKKDEFLLYPNPANEILYIATGMGSAQLNNLSLKVFNSLGQSVYEIPIENSNMEISTKNWGSSGVYFIKIFDASYNLIKNKKIILN